MCIGEAVAKYLANERTYFPEIYNFSAGGLVVECSLTLRKVVGSIPGRVIPKDCKNWYSLPPC